MQIPSRFPSPILLALALFLAPSVFADTLGLVLDDGATTEGILLCDLASGDLLHVDRPDREPTLLRYERVDRNLFEAIGRPTTQSARTGEILLAPVRTGDGTTRDALLAEGSTGYVAYLQKVGRGGRLGELTPTLGRPFDGLASNDGNYSLLPHRNDGGRTIGVWLYHPTNGVAAYYPDVDERALESRVLEVTGLPDIAAAHGVAVVVDRRGASLAFLVLDPSTGAIHRLETAGEASHRLSASQLEANLWSVFDAESGWRRFEAVGLEGEDRSTDSVLVLDPVGGKAAFLRGTGAGARLTAGAADLTAVFSREGMPAVVPHHQRGETVGVWVLDAAARSGFYLENLGPSGPTVRSVRFTRK